jgi:hypothetical protein
MRISVRPIVISEGLGRDKVAGMYSELNWGKS